MATDNRLFPSPLVRPFHDSLAPISRGYNIQYGRRSSSHEEGHNVSRNTLPFSWLRCFFHAFNATGQFQVKLEYQVGKWSRGMVSVFNVNGIRRPFIQERSIQSGDKTIERENHNIYAQTGNLSIPSWFIPFGPKHLPPIFTIGLGVSMGGDKADLLAKFDQHTEWLFPSSYLPADFGTKLLHVTIDQLVLLSPHWCVLSRDESDQLGADMQLVWFRQCMRAAGMTMDCLINLNVNSLRQRLGEHLTIEFNPVYEVCTHIKRFVEKYVPMSNSYGTEEIELIVSVCLQLIMQAAVRRLNEIVRLTRGTCDKQPPSVLRKTCSSNLTTMTSYNSLASTSSCASCGTTSLNEPMKSETGSIPIYDQSVPSRIVSIQPAQVVSTSLSKSSSKGEAEIFAKSLDLENIRNTCSSPQARSLNSQKYVNLLPPELKQQPQTYGARLGLGENKSMDFPVSVLTPCGEGASPMTDRLARLCMFKSHSSNKLKLLIRSTTYSKSAERLSLPLTDQLSQVRRDRSALRRFSQSTSDMHKVACCSLTSSSKLYFTTPASKMTKKPVDYGFHCCANHPMSPLFDPLERFNRAFYSGDQTMVSQSLEESTESRLPTIRELLSLKLILCTMIELNSRLGCGEAEMVNLLPLLHCLRVRTRGNQLIDQTVAVSLAYRIKQLTSCVSIELDQLITKAPINVSLIMDKLLLDSLSETTELIPPVYMTDFTGYETLYCHVSNLVNEIFESCERLRVEPNAIQVKTDSIATILSLLWASAYPAACFAIDQLLIDKRLPATCSCSYSKPVKSIECQNFDLSSQSDPTCQTDLWTTLVSSVEFHVPVIDMVQSSLDSKQVTVKPDESRNIILTDSFSKPLDDTLQQQQEQDDSFPMVDVDAIESGCSSPQPITCLSDGSDRNRLRYISVRSSPSNLTSRSHSLNQSMEHPDLYPECQFIPSYKTVHLTFDLSHKAQTNGDACGTVALQSPLSQETVAKTARESMQPLALDSHNAIQFCPACTNRLITCLHQNRSCPTIIRTTSTNQDVGVQYIQPEMPLNVGDKPTAVAKCQKCFSTESEWVQMEEPYSTRVMCKVNNTANHQLTFPPNYSELNMGQSDSHIIPDDIFSAERSKSQSTINDLVTSPSPVYHSFSVSERDCKPVSCKTTARELSLPTRSAAKPVRRMISPAKNTRQWPDPGTSSLCRTHFNTYPERSPDISSMNKDCTILNADLVSPGDEKVFRPSKAGIRRKKNVPMKNRNSRSQTHTTKEILAVNPFYSCLKDLRDCLIRAEARLSLVNYLVTQQCKKYEQHKRDNRVSSCASSANMQRGRPFEKSLTSTWSSIKHYASQVLLGQPRREPIPRRKHLSLSDLSTHQTNQPSDANHRYPSPSKSQADSKHVEHWNEPQSNESGARWTVDEIRSRGPGQFPSPSMELPVSVNLPNTTGLSKQTATSNKNIACRSERLNSTKSTWGPQQSHPVLNKCQTMLSLKHRRQQSQKLSLSQQRLVMTIGRIGMVLTQNGSRNTRRLGNANNRPISMV